MIIWLNGTFGAGKTSTAERLAALVPGGRVFDPETVGDMLRVNLGDRPMSNFQDWPAWRSVVAASLAAVAKMTDQHVIAAYTVLKQEYLEEIFDGLRAAGMDVFHVVLDAADAVLRSRIVGTEEAREWRLAHLDDYEKQRPWMVEAANLVVDTAASTPAQNARRILTALPGLPDPPPQPVVARKPQAAEKPATPEKAAEPATSMPNGAHDNGTAGNALPLAKPSEAAAADDAPAEAAPSEEAPPEAVPSGEAPPEALSDQQSAEAKVAEESGLADHR